MWTEAIKEVHVVSSEEQDGFVPFGLSSHAHVRLVDSESGLFTAQLAYLVVTGYLMQLSGGHHTEVRAIITSNSSPTYPVSLMGSCGDCGVCSGTCLSRMESLVVPSPEFVTMERE